MAPEDLVFWMGQIDGEVDARYGVLCRRHADSITVPRGWTLDDSRDPTLRLFRPTLEPSQRPRRPPSGRATSNQTESSPESAGEQLEFDDTRDLARPTPSDSVVDDASPHVEEVGGAEQVAHVTNDVSTAGESDSTDSGLARPPVSPLLARAFRGTPLER